jgi:histidinol-phosphatase (PHP family)
MDAPPPALRETRAGWYVSMHGGHSSEGSTHGSSTLQEMLDAAVKRGMRTYGVTNHAPVSDARFLADDEREAGIDLRQRFAQFEAYATLSSAAVEDYAGRLEVLRGFEAEVVPTATYVADMRKLRQRYRFEYVVGSVHFVDELPIDVSRELFEVAVNRLGGLEVMLTRYYRQVAEMVEGLRPEVIGHFDLPRLLSDGDPAHDARPVVAAATAALEAIAGVGSLLEVNTAAYRKGLRWPYPAPRLVQRAAALRIGMTLSDDSHETAQVGSHLETARAYLLSCGVGSISALGRTGDGSIVLRKDVAL